MGILWAGIVAVSIYLVVYIAVPDKVDVFGTDATFSLIQQEKYWYARKRVKTLLLEGLDLSEAVEYQQMAAYAHYIDDLGEYRIYNENNEPERADYFYKKLQRDKEEMGDLAAICDKIDAFMYD